MTDPSGPQFVQGGNRDGTCRNNGNGYYWPSSAYTSTANAYYLYLNGTSSTVGPAYNANKRSGFSLRCLAQ